MGRPKHNQVGTRSVSRSYLPPHTLPSDGSTASRPITALTDSLRALAVFRRCALNLFRPRARFLNFFFSSHAHELVVPDQMQLLNVGSCIRDRCAIVRFLFFLLTRASESIGVARVRSLLFFFFFFLIISRVQDGLKVGSASTYASHNLTKFLQIKNIRNLTKSQHNC